MFSGIQEILVLVIIILGILFLPRILNRSRQQKAAERRPAAALSGKMRLAIAVKGRKSKKNPFFKRYALCSLLFAI